MSNFLVINLCAKGIVPFGVQGPDIQGVNKTILSS